MKKNYFLTLLLTLFISGLSFGQVIITELADPNNSAGARFVEIYNVSDSDVDLTDWELRRWTNANVDPQGTGVDLTPIGTLAPGSFAIIAANGTTFASVYGINADIIGGTGGAVDSNGDDKIAIYDDSDTTIDIYGTPGVDSNNASSADNFEDGRAERAASVSSSNPVWTASEWNTDNDQGFGSGAQDAPGGFDPGAWIGETTSSEPSLTITSPADGSTIASTSSVDVSLSVSNFTVGVLNGSGVDGHIHWTLQQNSDTAVAQSMKYDTNDESITVVPGNSYTIYMELVDNSHTAITPAVNKTVTFSVALPCDLTLGDMATTCDTTTSGIDIYSGTIAFTGGNTGISYTISAPNGVTVGGDNPDTIAEGTITFSGMTEYIETPITIVGGAGSSCDFSETLASPTCVSFPIVEHFDYTDASTLGSQNGWSMLNSGDEMLVAAGNLDYTGLEASTGSKITFDETGSETYTAFSDVTDGTVYASFLLKVTGFQTGSNIDLGDGGYIAALAGSASGYDARFWVRPNPDTSGTTFDIGYGVESSNPSFTTATYDLNDVIFVVMSYNMDDSTVSTWINPDAASFEGTAPTATISGVDTGAPAAINLFVLRQDSNNETPFIELDALRISTSWADVTPNDSTASISNNTIKGFATYPNPITKNSFTITSNSSSKKKVAIFNVIGKKVLATNFSGTNATIDVSAINAGIYILKVMEAGKIATKKLVIR